MITDIYKLDIVYRQIRAELILGKIAGVDIIKIEKNVEPIAPTPLKAKTKPAKKG